MGTFVYSIPFRLLLRTVRIMLQDPCWSKRQAASSVIPEESLLILAWAEHWVKTLVLSRLEKHGTQKCSVRYSEQPQSQRLRPKHRIQNKDVNQLYCNTQEYFRYVACLKTNSDATYITPTSTIQDTRIPVRSTTYHHQSALVCY